MRWLALLMLLLAGEASAQGTTRFLGAPGKTFATGTNSGHDGRDVFACLIPDVQHMASGKLLAPDLTGLNCRSAFGSGCTSGACLNKSAYCTQSWRQTDAQLLYNVAYELTGQWGKMDYSNMDGSPLSTDNPHSFALGPLDHPRCDIIISLGDMADQPSFHSGDPNDIEDANITVFDDTAEGGGSAFTSNGTAATWCTSTVSEFTRHDWAVTTRFWQIIDASGIPYLPTKGNHDTKSCYRVMMNKLNMQSKSYFYAVETTDRQAWAIKVPTNTGKSFCIITIPDGFVNAAGDVDGTTAAERNFLHTNIGCGSNLPTIIEQHGSVLGGPTGPMHTFLNTELTDPNNSEVIALVGGHYITPNPANSINAPGSGNCGGAPGCAGQMFFGFFNWQELKRHGPSDPQFGTTADSLGGAYTIWRIMPERNQIKTYQWAPYFRSTNMPDEFRVPGSVDFQNFTGSFTWDARFP